MDLLGHPVMAHFCTSKSIPAHSQNLSSLFNCICSDWRLFVIAARSSAYAAELMVSFDVPNVYPFLPLCSHLSNGSRNNRNKYGFRVSPWNGTSLDGYWFCFAKVFARKYGGRVCVDISD